MGPETERVNTPSSESEVASALISAWIKLFGYPPAKEQIALLMAQNAHETGHRKSMWNYNIGNITAGKSWNGKYYTAVDKYTTGEHANEPFKWRAYDNLNEGALDYLKFLSEKRPEAWKNIVNPNPEAYARSLKEARYFTADAAPYAKSLRSLFEEYKKKDLTPEFDSLQQKLNKVHTLPTSERTRLIQDLSQFDAQRIADPEQEIRGLNSILDRYLSRFNANIPSSLPTSAPFAPPATIPTNVNFQNLDSVLDMYLKSASHNYHKQYLKHLPHHTINIEIKTASPVDKIEFANILCTALDEELYSRSFTHTDGKNVEIECNIAGPPHICVEAVQEVSDIVAKNFSQATKKIGSININTNVVLNKKSNYKPITLKTAETNHRKFLFKFI